MAKQTIGIGTTNNDGTGDPLRTAFDKTNDNFGELYDSQIPAGGTTGQVLEKVDGTDYNTQWATAAGGGGGDVSATGTPVANEYARWTDATTIEGRTTTEVRSDLNVADGATADSAASVAEIRDGTASKYITPANAKSALAFVSLTDAASVSWDMDTGINFDVTLGGNRTLSNPTNVTEGTGGVLQIKQDGTGKRTVTWGANFKHKDGTEPTLSTAASAVDTFSWFAETTTSILIGEAGAFS